MTTTVYKLHLLQKISTGYCCQICKQTWKRKPRSSCCQTVLEKYTEDREWELSQKYWTVDSISHLNLIPTTKVHCLKKGKEFIYFYDRSGKTEVIDSNLPPAIDIKYCQIHDVNPESPKLELALKRINLKPGMALPVGVTPYNFKPLYNPKDPLLEPIYPKFPRKIISSRREFGNLLQEYQMRSRNLKPKETASPAAGYWNGTDWLFLWLEEDCETDNLELPTVLDWGKAERKYVNQKDLYKFNCIRGTAKPVGCVWNGSQFDLYYRSCDCTIIDESLPPVVRWDSYFNNRLDCQLKTEIGLKRLNLNLEQANPVAVAYREESEKFVYKKGNFVYLYERSQIHSPYFTENIPEVDPFKYGDSPEIKHLFDSYKLEANNLKPRQNVLAVYRYWAGDDWRFLYALPQLETDNLDLPPIVNFDKIPQNLYRICDLKRINRRLTRETRPAAIAWKNGKFLPFYNPRDCEFINPSLPFCYDAKNLPQDLSTAWGWQQKEPLFDLKENAESCGCILDNNKIVKLYHRGQLVPHYREVYLSKNKLKSSYYLTDKFISLLGNPDRYDTIKVNGYMVSSHLYSRARVEDFLNQYAEDYVASLNKRGKTLALFSQNSNMEQTVTSSQLFSVDLEVLNRSRIPLAAPVIKEFDWNYSSEYINQAIKCLQCKSALLMSGGFFCAINPYGLELSQIPCPDWRTK